MNDFEKKRAKLISVLLKDIESIIAERTNQRLRDVVSIGLIRVPGAERRAARRAKKGRR